MHNDEIYEIAREDRREQILNELKRIILSNMTYTRFLESSGQNLNDLENFCDVPSLKVIFSSFMMMLWKDNFIIKDQNKNIISNLSEELLDDLVSKIARKDKNKKWKIGDIEFSSNYEVIDVVKNKLSHGDYLIDKNYLQLDIDGKTGYINIDEIVKFTSDVALVWDKISLLGENKQIFIGIHIPGNEQPKRITNAKELHKYLGYLYVEELSDKPKVGFVRNREYYKAVENFTMDFFEKMNNSDSDIRELPLKYSMKFEELGVELNYKSTSTSLLPNIKELESTIKKNKDFFKEKDFEKQLRYLSFAVYEKYTPHAPKKNITEGIITNQNILLALGKNKNAAFKELLELSDEKDNVSLPEKEKLDKSILAAHLCQFYGVYIYGLDKIYTDDERNNIDRIYEQKMFDFSKLDLSEIDYTHIETDKQKYDFEEQFLKNEKIKEKLQNGYFNIHNICNKLSELLDDDDISEKQRQEYRNKLDKQKKLLQKKNVEYSDVFKKVNFEKDFVNDKLEDYSTNRAVIQHLRNSISHGNVELNYVKGLGNRNETILKFTDFEDNNVTFNSEMTTAQFKSLYSTKNLQAVTEYLNENSRLYQQNNESESDNGNHSIIPFRKTMDF